MNFWKLTPNLIWIVCVCARALFEYLAVKIKLFLTRDALIRKFCTKYLSGRLSMPTQEPKTIQSFLGRYADSDWLEYFYALLFMHIFSIDP